MPKRGDVVLYSQSGKTFNAIVLALSAANDDRLGAAGEPALHLSVLLDELPRARPRPIGELPEMSTIHDVVHVSHSFSPAYLEKHGFDSRSHRGIGEWTEVKDAATFAAALDSAVEYAKALEAQLAQYNPPAPPENSEPQES